MEYVLMTAEHILGIAELEKICFSDPWSKKSISTELDNPLSSWIVAIDDGNVVGYIGAQSVLDGADIMNVAVSPGYRNRGVATELIEKMIAILAQKGVISLCLEVRISNLPAISLYEKLGFSIVGRRPGYYRAPKEDAYIMRKEFAK